MAKFDEPHHQLASAGGLFVNALEAPSSSPSPITTSSLSSSSAVLTVDLLRGLGVTEEVCERLSELGLIAPAADQRTREIHFGMDSGAVVTIAPEHICPDYPLEDTTTGRV